MQWPLLVVAVGSLVTPKGAVRSIPIHYTKNLSTEFLAQEERVYLDKCPCNDSGYVSKSLCLPVDFAGKKPRKEVFAFSVATNDSWKHYDWDQLTTVAWNEDKNLLCHAHSKGVKVVVKHNFDDMNQLCNISARQEWVQATYYKIVKNYADGVNIDTEKPSQGATSHCLGLLVNELRQELKKHALTKNAQITFDVPWAPRGVDGRYYPWRDLATAVDFLFVMSYDMRSQVFDTCVGGANSPLALVKQGLQEFILAYDIVPNKLVLGVPCDAAGEQIDYGNIRRLIKENGLVEQWDMMTLSPFVWLSTQEGGQSQIWFDNPRSLEEKYSIVRDLGLRGVGMWNADSLDYSAADDSKAMWSSLAAAFKA